MKRELGHKIYQLCSTSLSHPARKQRGGIPYDETHFITNFYPLKSHILLEERIEGYTQLRVIDTNSTTSLKPNSHLVKFPEPIFTVRAFPSPMKYNSTEIFYELTSFTTPKSYYSYDIILEALNSSKPWTLVAPNNAPISLVYRKNLFKKDGSNPLHLYGYGNYGLSFNPKFSSSIISLLDRGFVYAIAHVRGGSAMGVQWYKTEGKLLKKKNTFRDFSNAARHLVAKNYTSPGKLSVEGASAGGLLVGAAINLNPGLFNAAIMKVPYVDIINAMRDPTVSLTIDEYTELGDPNTKEVFDYIMSYSPYENLPKSGQGLPHLYIGYGFNDPRVEYWAPVKYVARLRATLARSLTAYTKHILQYIDMGRATPAPRGDIVCSGKLPKSVPS
ncbi:hypothetical protein DSO57_1000819 [Entomophthora muscae]|uniref:Uncharacterized protein n=1 Tax=Entomophthora muscae TaxID=34485 RepID=A0ACC2U7E9_9FUNG|nr:hypothetical protein DSO57_1000819 [Entomophthora muscae]